MGTCMHEYVHVCACVCVCVCVCVQAHVSECAHVSVYRMSFGGRGYADPIAGAGQRVSPELQRR